MKDSLRQQFERLVMRASEIDALGRDTQVEYAANQADPVRELARLYIRVRAEIKAAGTTVASFTMYIVGEGIEKKQDDFAAEVAAQVAAAKGQ